MQGARKFKKVVVTWLFRLVTLGLGVFLAAGPLKEPRVPFKDPGSFFIVSNPSPTLIGDALSTLIQNAATSIDLQIYALTDPSMIHLLNKKGLQIPITLYYDPKACPDLTLRLSGSVKPLASTGKSLMHRKVCLIDKQLVLLGSANYTTSSLYWHYNTLIGLRSKELAHFLNAKQRGMIQIPEGKVFLLPDIKNKALNTLIQKISEAKNAIHLAIFSLTHPDLIHALTRAVERGVKLFIYCDNLNMKKNLSNLEPLFKASHKVYTQKPPVLLHHKLCLIDDKILIVGSANWSKGGFKKNEEVLCIFDTLDKQITDQALQVFENLQKKLESYNLEAA